VQRATSQSKTENFRDYDVAESPPGFQAGWSDCMFYFSLFLFILFAHMEFRVTFYTHKGTVPYRRLAQTSSREEVGVSFVALGILEPQTARH
jgi:hypothetical protein